MTYDDINGVLLLINTGPVEILPESSFNSDPLLVEMLYKKYALIVHTHCEQQVPGTLCICSQEKYISSQK